MKRHITTIRAPQKWLIDVQKVADRLGITRTSAIMVCSRLGIQILDKVTMTQKQFDHLLKTMAKDRK
jgi:hypothetical protein